MIRACIKVDLPEPVRPAISTCCEVPWPSVRCCRLVAPALPSGTSMPARLSRVHHDSRGGAMNSNGTSTRLACLAAAPTLLNLREWRSRLGAADRGSSGKRGKVGVVPGQRAVLPGQMGAVRRRSLRPKPEGMVLDGIDGHELSTPQGTPPAAMAASRAADFSSNLVGKSATTSTR